MKLIRENLAYIFLGVIALILIFVTISLQTSILSSQNPPTDGTSDLIASMRLQLANWILPGSTGESVITTSNAAINRSNSESNENDISDTVATIDDGGNAISTPAQVIEASTSVPAVESSLVELNQMAMLLFNAENMTNSEDDNILAAIIGANRHAVGFMGYTYYLNNRDRLRAIDIRLPNGELVSPNETTVATGLYPLARPLFLYTSPSVIRAKPEVETFLSCYLNQLPQVIADTGYILPSRTLFAQSLQSFNASCQRCRREASATHPLADIVPTCDINAVSTSAISVVGSSTVAPLSSQVAERIRTLGYGGVITVAATGTSAGFRNFCVENIGDIVGASRTVKSDERLHCNEIDRAVLPFPVAVDALAIVVHRDNPFLQAATLEELQQIFVYAKTWSEVNPNWPNEPIARAIPGLQSGTFEYFVEAVMEERALADLAKLRQEPLSDSNLEPESSLVTGGAVRNIVGTGKFVDSNPLIRVGYLADGDSLRAECVAITERMALILEQRFGLQVELRPFPTADDLFSVLAAKEPTERIDLTFCYLDPVDRVQRQRYFNSTDFIDSGYRQSGENRLVIFVNRAVKLALERENRCLYQFFNDLDLDNMAFPVQNPIVWYEQNQTIIDEWIVCQS